MKKVLFLDRDGTLIIEPPNDFQVDSLEKLEFYPGVFQWLSRIAHETDYELVLITNQDGLGTNTFPEETFWPAHNKMIKALKNEGIEFSDVYIDKTGPEENAPTRKPGTALLHKYLYGNFDLKNSFVIGDRLTDIELAENLNAQGIFIGKKAKGAVLCTRSWKDIYEYISRRPRKTKIRRKTNETDIHVLLNLDGTGICDISTGLSFLDHMLEQIPKHGNFDLNIQVEGDLNVDEHHTTEDIALSLGEAFRKALGNKKGVERYGFILPMDDALVQVALDLGGRPYLVWDAEFFREKIGDVPTEMFFHFFKSFCDEAKCNLNIQSDGMNEHHMIEGIFKAFAKTLKQAVTKTNINTIPSTKGII